MHQAREELQGWLHSEKGNKALPEASCIAQSQHQNWCKSQA